MSQDRYEELEQVDEHFRPLRPAGGFRLVLAFLVGPIAWIVAVFVAVIIVERTNSIEFGALVTVASFIVAVPVLTLMHRGRDKEERAYDEEHPR